MSSGYGAHVHRTLEKIMSKFTLDIAKFVKKAKINQDVAVRKITFELFSRVIMKSPVDTGRFRGNWFTQIGSVSSNVNHSLFDKSGSVALNQAGAIAAKIEAGDVIYMSNSLPYAGRLEYGYSQQAPVGMVRVSIKQTIAWSNSLKF